MHRWTMWLFIGFAACQGGGDTAGDPADTPTGGTTPTTTGSTGTGTTDPTVDPTDSPTDPTGADTAPTDTASVTTDTGATTASGDTGIPTVAFDCSTIHPLPASYDTLRWVAPAEDFLFTPDGLMMAVHGGTLKSTEWGGAQTVLVPNLGDVRGTRMLPDGRVAMASIATGSILVVDPATGARETFGGLTNPNGIAIGADGRIYAATTGRIMAVDPADGSLEVIAEMNNRSFDGLSFSPDYQRLYFNEEVGRVHWVDFDANYVPGPVQDGPNIPIGAFSILDGMAVDACGNLYTTEMGSTVWRITPQGDVDVVLVVQGVAILPALNFGTGVGGWDAETLYVMDFLGKMYAVDVGVPGKWEPHWP